MKSKLVRIGNSQGIRIPRPLIEQAGLAGEVDLQVVSGSIVIKPAKQARAGWEESFEEMARRADDAPLDADLVSGTSWDDDQWQW
jgi:antitoxin MazE